MKVVAFNGSARKEGNTAALLREVFKPLEEAGIATELVHAGGMGLRGCRACDGCVRNRDRRCAVRTDAMNECIARMDEADGIILGSPVYFADVSADLKALIDRAGKTAKANGDMLRRKAGAAVVAVRRAGAIHAFDTINHFFLISQMVIPGSSYWNVGIGREPGAVAGDEEGMRTMRTLGENLAWLLQRMQGQQGGNA